MCIGLRAGAFLCDVWFLLLAAERVFKGCVCVRVCVCADQMCVCVHVCEIRKLHPCPRLCSEGVCLPGGLCVCVCVCVCVFVRQVACV